MTPSYGLIARRIAPPTSLAFLLALLFALAPDASAQRPLHPKELQAREAQREREERDEPLRREQWFYEPRTLPDGHVPANLRLDALRRMQDMMEAEGKLIRRRDAQGNVISEEFIIPPSTTQWTPIGPRPGVNTTGSVGNVSGRIGAIAVDHTDANIVYLGGAQGGIWKSTNGGTTWTPLTDDQASLAVGAIAIDPTSCSPAPCKTIYVGTGEQTFSTSSYYGAGILKSTDAGATWTRLGTPPGSPFVGPLTASRGGAFIGSLAVLPTNNQRLLAGVQLPTASDIHAGGVFCSNDGGNSWTSILGGAVATEVVVVNSTTAYAALGSLASRAANGIYKSTNLDAASCAAIFFSRLTGADSVLTQSSFGRIELAVAPSAPDTIYASIANGSVANSSSDLLGFIFSINGGTTWTQRVGTPNFCTPQCWYDQVIKVHPNNANVVYAGGSAANFSSGGYFIRSTNSGQSWTSTAITGSVQLHVDQHAIAFGPGTGTATKIYVGNDGGVWSSDVSNATAALNWTNLNADLQLTQFYPGMSIHPSDDQIAFGGTQDNSTQRYSGSLPWQIVTCGDGGWTAIDPLVPTTVYATCQNIDIRKSTNNGLPGTFLFADNGINPNDDGAFIPPFVIDPINTQRLYFGTTRVWQTTDGATTWSPISLNLAGSGLANVLTALAVSPASSSVVWAGSRTGRVFVATNVAVGSGTFNEVTSSPLPPRVITQIVPDPADTQTAYVTYSGFVFPPGPPPFGHVFKTTNGGTNWSDISGDLPNIPVNDLVVDPDARSTLYVATDVGVFRASDGGVTWSTLSVGLPRVAVLSLKLARASRVLRAATHGRGAWDFQLDPVVLDPLRLTSIFPLSMTANASAPPFTLTVNGAGFVNGVTQVLWNNLRTGVSNDSCASATQCTATIAGSLVASVGTAQISVANGPTVSNSLVFVVAGGVPSIANLNSQGLTISLNAGAGNTNITVNGTNFTSTSQVEWNLATTGITAAFVSSTQLTATVSSSLLAFGGVNVITVLNPPPGGGSSLINNNFAIVNVLAPAPANDNFAAATNATSNNFTNTVDNSAASTETNDPAPSCASGSTGSNLRAKSVWYRFTPNGSGTITADTIGSTYDTILQVITGNPPGTQVACNDDIVLGSNVQSQLSFPAVSGTTYNFMVSAFNDPAQPPWLANGGKTVFNLTASLTAPPYTLASPTGQQTVNAGQSAQYTINVTPQAGGFSSAITFSCTGLPTLSSCAFNPASVTPGAAQASTTLTISTTARSAVPAAPQSPTRPWPLAAPWLLWFVALALLSAALLAGRRFGIASRLPRRWRLAAAALPLVLLVLLFVLHVSGCGGGDTPPPPPPPPGGTPASTYTVTVNGTSGANVQSTTVSLRVN